jgi:hypothetical protein
MQGKAGEKAADELYAAPLAEFTQRRDDLARRLRKDGLRDEADAVKALRKPSAAAWALNQLARRRPKDVERLLAAGKRLRKAHEALLSGRDRAALQRASAEERELIDRLTRDAAAVASEAGAATAAALDERIRDTLHAAALDEQTAADLAAGRLVREREAIGTFGAATAVPASTGKTRRADRRREADSKKAPAQRKDLERALVSARADERKTQRARAAASKAAERARKEAAAAVERADEARKRSDEARAGLREAERQERDAAKAHDRAARALAAAEQKLR